MRTIYTFLKGKLEHKSFENILNLIFLITTLAGVGTSIFMNFVNRSLWVDEAALAYSFSTRSFWRLWDGAFEKNQLAPLGWLYFEKILAKLFGNTEFVIRIGSIMGFALTIILIWYLAKNCFHIQYPLGACAFYANMPFILKYSNVFKPYICDGFFVLSVIFLFYLYEQDKINFKGLAAGWAVLIWFANPTCFFEGGLLISEAIFVIMEKNWKKLKEIIIIGVTILSSFVIYYFFWLREVAVGSAMQDYWKGNNFPLIPTSLEDLSKMKSMALEIFGHIGTYQNLFFLCMIIALIAAVIKKNKIGIGLYIGILITCFASYINMFPVEDRLWCFIYSLLIIICFYGFHIIMELNAELFSFVAGAFAFILVYQNTSNKIYSGILFLTMVAIGDMISKETLGKFKIHMIGLLTFVLVFSNDGILHYLDKENVYWKGEELNNEITYLEENIKKDEIVYVYSTDTSGFQYKNGYGNPSIGEYENNIIFGKGQFHKNSDCEEEIEKIISHNKVYIVASHIKNGRISELLNAVYENGYFQLVSFDYETPLWFYCNNLSDSKIHVSYEVVDYAYYGTTKEMILRIHNDGEAYLNHNWETVSLVNCENGSRTEVEKNIAPGESVDVLISYEKDSNPVFRLENEYGLICEDSEFSPEEY